MMPIKAEESKSNGSHPIRVVFTEGGKGGVGKTEVALSLVVGIDSEGSRPRFSISTSKTPRRAASRASSPKRQSSMSIKRAPWTSCSPPATMARMLSWPISDPAPAGQPSSGSTRLLSILTDKVDLRPLIDPPKVLTEWKGVRISNHEFDDPEFGRIGVVCVRGEIVAPRPGEPTDRGYIVVRPLRD